MPPSSQNTKWSPSRGNSIGPEVTAAVQRILDAALAPIAWVECRAGLHAIDRGQNALPQETLGAIRKYQVALKGTQGRRRRPNNPLEVPMVQYRPGQLVPKSGIYRVVHDQVHIEAHDVTAVIGERFPPCHHCGQHPRFMLERAAHHLDTHPAFTRRATE